MKCTLAIRLKFFGERVLESPIENFLDVDIGSTGSLLDTSVLKFISDRFFLFKRGSSVLAFSVFSYCL